MIAPVEENATSSAPYTIGEQLIFNGVLCEATSAISIGDTLAMGTNLSTANKITNRDSTPTANSTKLVTSGGVYSADKATREMIAPVEENATSSAPYTIGEQLIFNGVLCEATSAISIGDTLAMGTNLSTANKITNRDSTPTANSTKLVTSGGVYSADNQIRENIANVEGATSAHPYTVGKQLIFNGLLCKVTSAISVGDTLAVGTNLALSDNVVEQIYSLNQGLTNSLADMNNVLGAKNLLPTTAITQTFNGVTFTANADGTVTVSGTATETTYYGIQYQGFKLPNKNLILSGCPSGGSSSTYELQVRSTESDSSQWQMIIDHGDSPSFVADNNRVYVSYIGVMQGQTVSNLVFKPMLRPASITDDTYVPYSMTNRELTDNYSKTTVRFISVKNTSGTWGDSIKNVLDAFRALTDIPDSDKVYIYDLQLSYMHLNVINAEYREFSSVRSNVKTYNCVGSNNNPKHILNAKIIDSGSSVELNRFSFEDSSLTNISSYTSQGSTSIHFLQLHNV